MEEETYKNEENLVSLGEKPIKETKDIEKEEKIKKALMTLASATHDGEWQGVIKQVDDILR